MICNDVGMITEDLRLIMRYVDNVWVIEYCLNDKSSICFLRDMENGKVMTFDTREEARKQCKVIRKKGDSKFKVRRLVPDFNN